MQPTTNLPNSSPLATLLSPSPAAVRAGVTQAPPRDGLLFADALADVTAGPAPIAAPPLPPLAASGKTLPVMVAAAVVAAELPVAETIAPATPPQAPRDEPTRTEPAPVPVAVGQMPKAMSIQRPAAKRQPARHPAPEPETGRNAPTAVSASMPPPLASPALVVAEAIRAPVITKPGPSAPDVPTAAPLTDTGALPPMALPRVAAPVDGGESLPSSLPNVALDHLEASTPASIAVRADHATPALVAPRVSVPVVAGDRQWPAAPPADGVAPEPAPAQRHAVQSALTEPDAITAPVLATLDPSLPQGTLNETPIETPDRDPVMAEIAASSGAAQPAIISVLSAPQVSERPMVPPATAGDQGSSAPTTIAGRAPLPTIVAAPVPVALAQPQQRTTVAPAGAPAKESHRVLGATLERVTSGRDAIAASASPFVDRSFARAIPEGAALAPATPLAAPGMAVAAPTVGWRSPVLRDPIDEPVLVPPPAIDSVDTTQALRARINVAFAAPPPQVPATEAPEIDLLAIEPAPAAAAPAIDRTAAIDAPSTPVPVATGDPAWIDAMIDRIETLRDTAGARETRIRLTPDALGAVEVTIRETAEGVQVQLTADTPAARALLAEAAPRLAEMADARGLKLGQPDAGAGQQNQQQRASHEQQRAQPARSAEGGDINDTDERIA